MPRPDSAQGRTKPEALSHLAVERPVHATCTSWPASQEGGPSQHNNSGHNRIYSICSSSPNAELESRRSYRNSAVWTSTDSSIADNRLSETQNCDEQQQQSLFIHEYNKLAEKYGLHILHFDEDNGDRDCLVGDRRSWFARTFGKPPTAVAPRRSSRHSIGSRSDRASRHKRDSRDSAVQSHSSRKDTADKLKNESLQTLVRICGKSFLYLPSEYAARSLMLPTCLRAAAQYLVQNGPGTRGVFRISGSMRVVNELYDYYCADLECGRDIAATVRSPNLPFHIKVGVHNVASLFKRLLAGLPGGVLGEVSLFNALAEIHKTFGSRHGSRLEKKHILARLLALAIGSVPSSYQRELICAVFGLLSLIGNTSELSPSLDSDEALLANSERMGYGALGIIFGPLLLGDLLETSGTEEIDCSRGRSSMSASATAPSSPTNISPRFKADRRPKSMVFARLPTLPAALDKILLANDVTETVITHWKEVVSEMRVMGVMGKQQETQIRHVLPRNLRPCRSEAFADNCERALPPKTPAVYASRLRKARSASIEHSTHTTVSVKRNTLGQGVQRPADMTFEEFATRKRLKSQASSVSMSSEATTHVAPSFMESVTLPCSAGPLAATSPHHPAKPKKLGRVDGGLLSPFPNRAMPTGTEKSSVGGPDFPLREVSTAPSQAEGNTPPSPWKIKLKPVRPVPTASHENATPTSSPTKYAILRPSEETIVHRATKGPPSKTATLISRIMSSRHQSVNQENMAYRDHSRTDATSMSPRSPFEHEPTDGSPFERHRARGDGLAGRGDTFRCMIGSAANSSTTLRETPTPTPKQHRYSSLDSISVTPGKSPEPGSRTADANIQTPFAEIKNDARGLKRAHPRTVTALKTPLSPGTLEKKMRGDQYGTMPSAECKDIKPVAAGSTVKAMAALFDNTTQNHMPTTPPAKQTQKAAWLQKNLATVTPHTPRRHGRMADADGESRKNTSAKTRNQLRLSRSEDRNARANRVGRPATIDRNDLTRSADRGTSDTLWRKGNAAEATPETCLDWKRSTGQLPTGSKRGTDPERSAEDSRVAFMAEHYTQRLKMQELEQSLQAKATECQTWRDRAEVAERRVAELETYLTAMTAMSDRQNTFRDGKNALPWVSS